MTLKAFTPINKSVQMEFDIKELASRLAKTYQITMPEALTLASQMKTAEMLSEIRDKISDIEYKLK